MRKENLIYYNYFKSNPKQPIALFGQPIKNATVIIIPRKAAIIINRLFIVKIKNSGIKSNGIFKLHVFTFKNEIT